MVLETLTNPYKAEAHPAWLLLHGAIYTIIAFGLAQWLWPGQASMVFVFLITAACIPLLYNIIKYEEEKDYYEESEVILLKEHSTTVLAYFMLFIGVTLTIALLFILTPEQSIYNSFQAQIQTLQAINPHQQITGAATLTGAFSSMEFFTHIFLNNMKVLLFCIIFSFLYGAGAIFILVWNGSVLGIAIGDRIRTLVAEIAGTTGIQAAGTYLGVGAHTVFLRYGIHGSLEMIAYIIAGLAGGIISVATIRHHWSTRKFEHIVMDSADLILLAIAILFVAGVWEAWVTPFFYTI